MLANAVSRLADTLDEDEDISPASADPEREAAAQARNAEAQERLAEALEALQRDGIGQVDAESRMRLRSMDVQMLRILEEMSAGRQESLGELRADLSELTKAVRLLARDRAF